MTSILWMILGFVAGLALKDYEISTLWTLAYRGYNAVTIIGNDQL